MGRWCDSGTRHAVPAGGRGDAPRMQTGANVFDLLLVLAMVAFFGVGWAYVRFCEGLGGAP